MDLKRIGVCLPTLQLNFMPLSDDVAWFKREVGVFKVAPFQDRVKFAWDFDLYDGMNSNNTLLIIMLPCLSY
jgi:hypothetical protein